MTAKYHGLPDIVRLDDIHFDTQDTAPDVFETLDDDSSRPVRPHLSKAEPI